ncbi:MAG: hypothetical protein JWN70_5479 [Planctomycetaceae bacterium]|nr:hypothetical protein [Planctomycetaceae bacterium]
MIYAIAIILVVFNWLGVGAGISAFGQRLALDQRPFMMRLRWLGIGMLLALALCEYPHRDDGWVGWLSVSLLAVGSTRRLVAPPLRSLPPLDNEVIRPLA